MRVVRKSDLLPAVRVVIKKVRGEKEAADGSDGRRGLDMQGLKPGTLLPSFAARLKSCPEASLRIGFCAGAEGGISCGVCRATAVLS